MFKKTPHIILMSLLSSSLLLTACKKADEPAKTEQSHTSSSTDQVMEKLNERPVKKFAATADDAHDIALLEDYDRRFTEMSDEMETELEKMHAAGTLTTEFEQKRTLDNVRSALTMLKDLDLKLNKVAIFKAYFINIGKIKKNISVINRPIKMNKSINLLTTYKLRTS